MRNLVVVIKFFLHLSTLYCSYPPFLDYLLPFTCMAHMASAGNGCIVIFITAKIGSWVDGVKLVQSSLR